jgi:acyl-CoA reductase-like NAD-dependent aldehyde dehydrogenase
VESHSGEGIACFQDAFVYATSFRYRTYLDCWENLPLLFVTFAPSSRQKKYIAMADTTLANLQATALTARCHNPFFRQKQLKALHDTLRQNVAEIKNAIASDSCISEQEATTEVAMALNLVKEYYDSINTSREIEEEYLVGQGKDDMNRRAPWGVAYIEPHKIHTPFFSAITALCAALTSGNCVALKVRSPRIKQQQKLISDLA